MVIVDVNPTVDRANTRAFLLAPFLSKNKKITESPNMSVSVLATLVKMNISIGPISKVYKRMRESSNFALFQNAELTINKILVVYFI